MSQQHATRSQSDGKNIQPHAKKIKGNLTTRHKHAHLNAKPT